MAMITDKCKLVENCDGGKGRGIISTGEFKVGEILFSEESFSSIPFQFVEIDHCYLCCKPISIDFHEKSKCGFGCNMYFCSENCLNDMTHQLECSFVNKFIKSSIDNSCDVSISLLALRIIIKNKINNDQFQETVGKLKSQSNEFLINNKNLISKYQNSISEILVQLNNEKLDPSILSLITQQEYIEIVCSILTNSFAGLSNDFSRSIISNGFFYKPALLNHSCEPNVFFNIQDSNLEMRVIKPIGKDEEILDSYVDLLLPTIERQNILLKSKNFVCKCARCSDATEGGRHLSSIYCMFCNDSENVLAPKVNYYQDSNILVENWKCSSADCQFNKEVNNNQDEFNAVLDEIQEFKQFINSPELQLDNLPLAQKDGESTKSTAAEEVLPIFENIIGKVLKYEVSLLSKLHLNHQAWLLYHIRLSKTFEKLSVTYNSFDYLVQSIQHFKEMTRIVEAVLTGNGLESSISSEVIDCYFHLGRINEKYLLSLIKQRNHYVQLKLENKHKENVDVDKLNNDIKNLLKFINQSYLTAYNKSVLLYGINHPKSISLNEMVLKSNLKSSTATTTTTTTSK